MRLKNKNGSNKVLLNYKLWLSSITGDGAVGDTEYRLLKHIAKNKSLKAASDELGISYRKAWGDLKKAEDFLGYQLLNRKRGGKSGGTSEVTEKARRLIEAYEALQQKMDDHIEIAFQQFKDQISK